MQILRLCLLAVQIFLMIGIFVLLWQIRRFIRREDLPEDDPLPAKEARFVVVRMQLMCTFLIVNGVISILLGVWRFIGLLA